MKYTLAFLICLIVASTGFAQTINGRILTDASKEKYKANTVIYIETMGGDFKAPKENPVMNQKGLKFEPFVLPVVVGSTVDFLNSDDVLHNVFSPDKCCDKFDLGSWTKNEIRSYTYTTEGCQSVVLCNVHPEMEAYVIVLQNPFFAITDKDGNYEIKGVPEGKYTLMVWNSKLKSKPESITVTKNGTTQDFKLTR